MVLMSRRPLMAMLSVRGMGVAESVSISTPKNASFSFSLCFTPKRCSSSTMTRPRSLNFTSFCKRRCVPTTRSTVPSARPRKVARICFCVAKRDNSPILTGKACMRAAAVW